MPDLRNLYDQMIQHFPAGKCITFLLNNTGSSATQIAHKVNIHYSYISLMINGHRPVDPSVKSEVYSALGFDPWEPPAPS